MTYAYYALWSLNILFMFLVLPLAYFYFDEKYDSANGSTCQRIISAFKFTCIFIIILGVMMCIGAFVSNSDVPACAQVSNNGSDPSAWVDCKSTSAESSFTDNRGTNAISFTIGILTVFGFYYVIMYTATGMAALPFGMIKSRTAHTTSDVADAERSLKVISDKRTAVQAKYKGKTKSKYSSNESDTLFQVTLLR